VPVQGSGTKGVTALDADDAAPVPAAFVAVTVKVYDVPLVKPDTVSGLDEPDAVNEPGLDVAVYDVIALPPLDEGAVNVTLVLALPAVAVPMVGAPGTVIAVIELDALDAAPVPTAFVALTVKVYDVP
jgi:hypothetical protein